VSAAERHAAELDAATPIMVCAAQLAGVNVDADDGTLLTMCVDPIDMHRRELWGAWEHKDGRCGKWAALAALGAPIRAATLENVTPYRRPRPMETRRVPTKTYGIYQDVVMDPESDDYVPLEPERAMIPGTPPRRMVTR
jgi:hypothetical protein